MMRSTWQMVAAVVVLVLAAALILFGLYFRFSGDTSADTIILVGCLLGMMATMVFASHQRMKARK